MHLRNAQFFWGPPLVKQVYEQLIDPARLCLERLHRFGVPSPSQHALACWQLEDIAFASKRDWEKDRMRGFNL